VLQVVAGQGNAPPLAPPLHRQGPVLDPQLVHEVVEIEAHSPVVPHVVEDACQVVTQVVALALPELPEQVWGDVESGAPRAMTLCRQVRLVGEHGGNFLPQLAELARVGLVGAFQKGNRRARVK
jgi:hypothetical protein